MPNYESDRKCDKLRKPSANKYAKLRSAQKYAKILKSSQIYAKSRYAVPADSVCEAAEQDGPDQKAKH
jgi:hypothetical protein